MNAYDIIKKPLLSEKSYATISDKKYTFVVDLNANKIQIKQAVEEIFKVKVKQVNTLIVKGKEITIIGTIKDYKTKTKKDKNKTNAKNNKIKLNLL